jgi:uncharacterized membrane protein
MSFKYIFTIKGIEIPVMTLIGFLVAFIWAIGMVIAPLTLPPDSVLDLTPDEEDMDKGKGGVGHMDNEDITKDMNPYAKFYYEAGDSQCHQIKERSFFIIGNQMPFCVRDVAIFFGMAIALGIALFIRFELKLWWLIGGLVPIGIDGTLQLLTSYESNNAFRLITGLLAGLVASFALGYVFYDFSKSMEIRRTETQTPYDETEQVMDYGEPEREGEALLEEENNKGEEEQ